MGNFALPWPIFGEAHEAQGRPFGRFPLSF
jgi:hypothetical protein